MVTACTAAQRLQMMRVLNGMSSQYFRIISLNENWVTIKKNTNQMTTGLVIL